MSRRSKLGFHWLRPYKISKAYPDKGTYLLIELDRTPLAGMFTGNRLKKFVRRNGFIISLKDIPDSLSQPRDLGFNLTAGLNQETNATVNISQGTTIF